MIWCVLTIPTITSFIHDMVCANNTHHHIIHPLWCANNSHHHIIHPQYDFCFEDYASLIVTQQIQTFAIVQINNLFLVRPNTLKTSLINVIFCHHGWQIWQFQYLQYYESSPIELSHFQFVLGSWFDQRDVYFNHMMCTLRINLCPFLYT
jgi:hypothetical protein